MITHVPFLLLVATFLPSPLAAGTLEDPRWRDYPTLQPSLPPSPKAIMQQRLATIRIR